MRLLKRGKPARYIGRRHSTAAGERIVVGLLQQLGQQQFAAGLAASLSASASVTAGSPDAGFCAASSRSNVIDRQPFQGHTGLAGG